MKYLSKLAFSLIAIAGLSACGGSSSSNNELGSSDMLGTWKVTQEVLEIKIDGKDVLDARCGTKTVNSTMQITETTTTVLAGKELDVDPTITDDMCEVTDTTGESNPTDTSATIKTHDWECKESNDDKICSKTEVISSTKVIIHSKFTSSTPNQTKIVEKFTFQKQ